MRDFVISLAWVLIIASIPLLFVAGELTALYAAVLAVALLLAARAE